MHVALGVDGAAYARLWREIARHRREGVLMGRVAVLGSLNVDVGTLVERHPLPGETVLGRTGGRFRRRQGWQPGGCGRAAGADVQMLARVGGDEAGTAYRSRLTALGIDAAVISTSRTAPTGTALITGRRAGGELDHRHRRRQRRGGLPPSRARPGASGPGTCCSARSRWTSRPSRGPPQGGARDAGARVVINLAPYAALPHDVIALADPVVVNESEMALLADLTSCRSRSWSPSGRPAGWGPRGWTGIPVPADEVWDTVGAGDASLRSPAPPSPRAPTARRRSRPPTPPGHRRCDGAGPSPTRSL